MAVFTPIELGEIAPWISQEFTIGQATDIRGIHGGIENSNFFLDTTKEVKHCALVGEMLAKMHLAGKDFPRSQENLRSLSWWQQTIPLVLPHLNTAQKELLTHELSTQEAFFSSSNYDMLPQGASHCDLFRDNVLFDPKGSLDSSNDQLGGFFDFYFAGTDKWLFDLAVTVNDWCLAQNKQDLDPARFDALMNAYQSVRPLTKEEQASWPLMVRAAALRFWVSRLWDFYLPRDAQCSHRMTQRISNAFFLAAALYET